MAQNNNNRTGTARWQRIRRATLNEARAMGQTNCPDCRVVLDWTSKDRPKNHAEVDHIVPHALGGGNEPENLRVVCKACNSRKGHRMLAPQAPADDSPGALGGGPPTNDFPHSRRW